MSGFGKSVGKVGGLLKGAFAFAAGAAVVGQFKDIVKAGSDLNETMSKSKTIFGPAAADIEKFGANAAKSLGLSKEEAISGAAAFGNFFDQIGIGKKASADLSKSFLTMSGDLASFNNANPAEVMDAFQSATRGEYDALQRFIPTINAATVQQEAMRVTGKKSAKDLSEQDKAIALHTLAVKGQGKAQGDFARTSGGLANQQRILTAQIQNAKAAIGTALLPVMTKMITFLNDKGVPAIKAFGEYFKTVLWPVLKDIGTTVGSVVLPVFKALGDFFTNHTGTVKALVVVLATLGAGYLAYSAIVATVSAVTSGYAAVTAVLTAAQKAGAAISLGTRLGLIALNAQMIITQVATGIWTAVQWLLNAAFLGFPLVWIVAAILALIAVIVLAIKYHQQIGDFIVKIWNIIKNAIGAAVSFVINFLKANWPLLLAIITGPIGLAVLLIVKHWDTIKSATSAAFNAVRNAITTVLNAVKGFILSNLNDIKAGFQRAWDAIRSAVVAAFNAVRNAISSAINGYVSLVTGIKGRITGALSGAASWLYDTGKNIIQGLINGIGNMAGAVLQKAKDIANTVKDAIGSVLKIGSPSKLMIQFGRWVGEGLSIGINKSIGLVARAGTNLSGAVAAGFASPQLDMALVGAASTGTTNVNITVAVPVSADKAMVGKAVKETLDAYYAAGGRK